MKTMRRRLCLPLFTAVALLLTSCSRTETPAAEGPDQDTMVKVAVVPKGTTHDFWKSVEAGAERAARDLEGVVVTFTGSEREDDRAQQIALVENLITSGYGAIVLAPLDHKALVAPVRLATEAGIPVVIIDSGLDAEVGKDFVSFVATDNTQGGRMAGEKMVELLQGTGRVLLLRYQEGSASTDLRESGFVEAIAEAEGIELIDPGRYAGATRATAQEAAENLLSTYNDINGIFCPNESSTYGMLLALRSRDMAGTVRFVGFDASEGLIKALADHEIDALVVQNPIKMGELGVHAAVEAVRGGSPAHRIDTGVMLVTPANMHTPEARELIAPDFAADENP